MKTKKPRSETAEKTAKHPKPVTIGNATVRIYRYDVQKGESTYPEFKVVEWFTEPSTQRRKRKLHAFGSLEDARDKATEIANALNTGEVAALSLTNKDKAAYQTALERLKPTGVPLEIAALHFAEAFKVLGSDRILEAAKHYAKTHPVTLAERTAQQVVAELVADAEQRKLSERYLEDLKYRCGRFAASVPGVQLASITSQEIRTFLLGLNLSSRSHDNFLRTVNTLFEFAKSRKYLPRDFDELADIEFLDENAGEIEIYSAPEVSRLLAAASDDLKPALAIGAFAGLRSAEIERLDWSEVHFRDSVIEVRALKAKTGSRRIVPMSKNLAAWLKPYAQKAGPVWPHSHAYFYEAQRDAAKATADKDGENAIEWKRNALRHSYGSYRLAIVQDPAKVAYEMGNSPKMVTKHYRQIRLPDGTLITPANGKKWFAVLPPTKAAAR